MDASEPLGATPEQLPSVSDPSLSELSTRDLDILDFERQWWRHAGSKEQAIRDRFSLSPTRYYQLLNRLLDNPYAMKHDPMLVKRLRRLRAARTRTRAMRRLGVDH